MNRNDKFNRLRNQQHAMAMNMSQKNNFRLLAEQEVRNMMENLESKRAVEQATRTTLGINQHCRSYANDIRSRELAARLNKATIQKQARRRQFDLAEEAARATATNAQYRKFGIRV